MADLSTNYLGLELKSPLVPSASPLSEQIDDIRRLEDAGASAVVLHSLFEEQLRHDTAALDHHLSYNTESFAEALSFFPEPSSLEVGPDTYLEHIRRAKQAVDVPIIASLNGTGLGAWTSYATQIEEAGADALELNVYWLPSDPARTGADVESEYLQIVRAVRDAIRLPLAVKLSPYFSSLPHMASQLASAGVDGLVMFNRFYQPDVDLETLEITPRVLLSTPAALRLPLTWIGILYGKIDVDLAATSGIHSEHDVLKLLMVGAKVTMLCSVLLKRGISQLSAIERRLRDWLDEHEYDSVRQMQGSMSQRSCPDPASYERAQYLKMLHSYRPEHL